MLLRQQPQPGRELSSLAEGCAVTDGGHDRGCNQRSDTRNLPQSPTRFIARSDPFPFVVHLHDLNLTSRMRNLVALLWSERKALELQIVQMNDRGERTASSDESCRR